MRRDRAGELDEGARHEKFGRGGRFLWRGFLDGWNIEQGRRPGGLRRLPKGDLLGRHALREQAPRRRTPILEGRDHDFTHHMATGLKRRCGPKRTRLSPGCSAGD